MKTLPSLRLRSISLAAAAALGLSLPTNTANAGSVRVKIDVSSQSMNVTVNGRSHAQWDVSTARRGYHTPRGNFGIKGMSRMHYSRKYHMAPMPYALFFLGGFAIHGTGSVGSLGSPASHGCVRLHTAHAARLYRLVQHHGPRNTRVVVTN